jgi:putative transport protein
MSFLHSWIVALSLCIVAGHALGTLKFRNLSLGSSGILFVGMALGSCGAELPEAIQSLGLMLFIYSVGTEAGPGFFAALRGSGIRLAVIGFCTVASGFIATVACGLWFGGFQFLMPTLGFFLGDRFAVVSTPALATALDGLLPEQAMLVTTAYGLAYPVGVVSVVLFIQSIGRIGHVDVRREEVLDEAGRDTVDTLPCTAVSPVPIVLVIGCGYLAGDIPLPLSEPPTSLGTAGGVLCCALFAAHMKKIGKITFSIPHAALVFLRELGLMGFLAGVGVRTGGSLDTEALVHGVPVLLSASVAVTVAMSACWLLARNGFGMPFLFTLGAVAGGMTSTPGLAAASSLSARPCVSLSYATVYPVALISMILMIKLLYLFVAPRWFYV